ncbi:ABC transporter ATP-binding protein [Pseudidiomarina sp.]|uniref:ABC transporter ATP-binding protein n=1 Tax=Pseudidiomarina sp. TaxID=2081707 RepID=UPI00299D7E9D|nr:ATP-binding cassette domain-containing protein [Pseudidiomarina sp.]MDX1706245.1 ATP-binding cassette domain-containing protein [Pseudidiomarina sp.]
MLEVSALSVSGRLENVSWAANGGGLIGILGANGAGKSTLLQCMTGQLQADSGNCWWQQQPIADMPVQARRQLISYLPQHPSVSAPVSVNHVLTTGLVNLQLPVSLDERVRQVAREFNLTGLLSRPITQLSGGEQRRVHLARSLSSESPLALCDEPVAGLDLYYQLRVMELLKQRSDNGQLICIALHDLALAARYCDQLVLLHQGRLLASGQPMQVLTPENLRRAYGIKAQWWCEDGGVAMLPTLCKENPDDEC